MKSLSRHLLRRAARPLALCLAVFVPRPALALPLVQQPTSAEVEVLKQQALAEAEAGQVDAAIRDYGRVLSISPDWKEGWWNLGTLQYGANRFSEAKTSFGRVVAFAPAFGTAWRLLGLSEFETGDFAASLTHLEKAQALGHDDDPEIQRVSAYHLALLLLRSGAFERVSDLLLTTFGQGTPSPQVTYALGLALLRVPLLPAEIDPSLEATIMAAGDLATRPETSLARFPAFLAAHPELPYAHYAYGLALSKAGRNPEALAQMQLETRLSPNSPLPWLAISRIESQLGDPAKAQAAAAQAEAARTQALAPGVPEPPEERIRLRYALAGATSPPSSTHAEDPNLWAGAMAHYTASQYAPAVSDLKQWLQTHPVDGTAWAVLGLSEFALGDLGSAQLHLTRGETLGFSGTPTAIATARYTLAILLLRAGDFDHASHLLEQSPKPLDPKSEYALGLALLHRPELPGATDSPDAPLIRAAGQIAILLQNSRYDQALTQFRHLIDKYPSAPFLHYACGTALLALSEFPEAAAEMRAEILISPTTELPWIRLASIALRQHQPADALDPARHALALAPQSTEAHYLLGRASLETGDDATALRELETARRLSPGSPEIHFNLARAYTRAKMPDQAATERAAFAQLNQLSETERTRNGSGEIYAGPHDPNSVTVPAAPQTSQ